MAISHEVRPRTGGLTAGRTQPRKAVDYIWGLTRISLGSVFAWAFVDKLFGLGHATPSARSWLNGGSPTNGFLSHSTGPFSGMFKAMAGSTFLDWLFMLGLLGIGAALLLGIGMRFAAVAGSLLLVLMWAAALPPENHIFMDDHLIYAPVLIGLALVGAGRALGIGGWWSRTRLVTRYPWLV